MKTSQNFKTLKTALTSIQKLKLSLLIILIGTNSLQAQSQNEAQTTIAGKVMDEATTQPVSYATVIIKSVDGQNITGGITDDQGQFEIKNVSIGNYLLEVQFIGYVTLTQPLKVDISSPRKLDFGVLNIQEATSQLDEVTVTAERSTIEQKLDRKVINIGKDLSTTGARASDIMINLPSVDIDQNGNVSLRGNANVQVLVDGRITNISANQLLQQIPSSSIKSIELITNPSAKYNPEGMSGIINIVLKKDSSIGFNGNINTGVTIGREERWNSSLDLNYRTGKVNFYGNYGHYTGKSPVRGNISRKEDLSEEIWRSESDRNSHLAKVGIDFYLNDQNTISFYTNQNTLTNDVIGTTNITFGASDNRISQRYESARENNTAVYNIDYKRSLSKPGHYIELEIDQNMYRSSELTDFFLTNEGISTTYTDDITDDRINTTINLDYAQPLSDQTLLELGAEARLQQIDNSYNSTNFNNSEYTYDRDIYSIYGTFKQSFDQWSYQLGLRLENYKVTGDFRPSGEINNLFKDQIFSVYPSAFIAYTPGKDKKNTYQLSYSRRVDRPGLNQINPIRVWSSARVTDVGNPNLVPQFTNSLEFNYIRVLKNGSVTGSVFYRSISDEITRFAFNDPVEPSNILFSYNNNDDNSAYGFEVTGNYEIRKWWNFNSSIDLYSQKQRGLAEGESIEADNLIFNARMNHSFKATKRLTFQIIGLYRGANENLQFTTRAYYFLNTGIRYSIAKGKGTISLSYNDILGSQQFAFDATRPLIQEGAFIRDTQTLFVGFSYRFGGKSSGALKRKKRDRNEKRSGSLI